MSKKPNNFLAPAVIAGVTIGFLAAGYQLVFGEKKPKPDSLLNKQAKQDAPVENEAAVEQQLK